MSELVLIARLGLTLLFVVAAIAKLADLASFRDTLADFGLRAGLARWGALAIVAAEITIAVLLVPASTARVGALAAVVLLATFCLAIARVLRRGDAPDCGCFGSRSTPVSRSTLARNAGLALVAASVAVAGPGAALAAPPVAALIVAAFVAQGWFAWQLFRQHGRLLERVRALEERAEHPQHGLTVVHRRRVGGLDQRLRNLEH